MVASKRQQLGSRWYLTNLTAAFAVALCVASLLRLSTVSKCEQDVYSMVDNHPNQLNGQKRTPSLSSQHSYGFFDDIPDDSWKIMQERARSSGSYSNRENPEQAYQYTMYWYMNNLQVRERQGRVCAKLLYFTFRQRSTHTIGLFPLFLLSLSLLSPISLALSRVASSDKETARITPATRIGYEHKRTA